MDNIVEIIKEKYNSAAPEIREALFSPEFAATIEEIGQNQKLDIEKTGVLFEEITLVLLGEISSKDFEKRLVSKLDINNEIASPLVKEVNERVFSPLRKSIITEEVTVPTKETVTENSNIDRESILAEIENPAPTIHPISAADQTIAGPAKPREIITERNQQTVARDFIAGKLTETVNLPPQNVTITPDQAKKNYSSDPYRESIK